MDKLVLGIVKFSNYLNISVVLPFIQEYAMSGEFTVKAKLKDSLRINLIWYAVYLALGVLFAIYIFLTSSIAQTGFFEYIKLRFFNLVRSKTQQSHCLLFCKFYFFLFMNSGVFQIILCLGFALPNIPKRYLQETNEQINLRYWKVS